ncbi:MAG: TraX family protein [Oscillospiraceae bacterium]
MTEEALPTPRRGLSSAALKAVALVSMCVDHFAASGLYSLLALRWGMSPAAEETGYLILRILGRLAFPLYCFLLTEGFRHTHSRGRYALRLGLFALLSEAPFDLAFMGSVLEIGYQNVFFTLLLGLLALMAAEALQKRGLRFGPVLAVIACGLLAELLRTDYGFWGVAVIGALYLLREKETEKYLAAGALLLGAGTVEIAGWSAFYLIHRYDGRRGYAGRALQWGFYLFYPAHLLIFALAVRFLR